MIEQEVEKTLQGPVRYIQDHTVSKDYNEDLVHFGLLTY